MVAQGELWLLEAPNQKSRPALVVTRDQAIPVLNNVIVAPVTRTIRDIPTCVPVGPEQGIEHESAVTFDNLAAVPKTLLTRRLGQLDATGRERMCAALRAVADC